VCLKPSGIVIPTEAEESSDEEGDSGDEGSEDEDEDDEDSQGETASEDEREKKQKGKKKGKRREAVESEEEPERQAKSDVDAKAETEAEAGKQVRRRALFSRQFWLTHARTTYGPKRRRSWVSLPKTRHVRRKTSSVHLRPERRWPCSTHAHVRSRRSTFRPRLTSRHRRILGAKSAPRSRER
jgi:hypothetical protein